MFDRKLFNWSLTKYWALAKIKLKGWSFHFLGYTILFVRQSNGVNEPFLMTRQLHLEEAYTKRYSKSLYREKHFKIENGFIRRDLCQ